MVEKVEIGYDRECEFCNHSIKWLRRRDRKGRLSYRALSPGAECVTLRDEAGNWESSTAVLRVMKHLGGGWRMVALILMIVPKPIRDAVYRMIARHRHRLIIHSEVSQNSAESRSDNHERTRSRAH